MIHFLFFKDKERDTVDERNATKGKTTFRKIVRKSSGGNVAKDKGKRKAKPTKKINVEWSDSDDSVNICYYGNKQSEAPGQQSGMYDISQMEDERTIRTTIAGCSQDQGNFRMERHWESENEFGSENEFESKSTEDDSDFTDNNVYEISNRKWYIRKVQHSFFSKKQLKSKKLERCYNAYHACPFGCIGLRTNFSVHIKSQKHSKEPEVKLIREADRLESQRLIRLLRMKADHAHNKKMIDNGEGEILLARKDSKARVFDIKDYGPCPNCFYWLRLSFIKRHILFCIALSDGKCVQRLGELKVRSRILSGVVKSNASQLLKREVFPIMKNDAIGVAAQSDDLIITYGNEWMTRTVGNKLNRKYYTSQGMRMAARMKLELNRDKEDPIDLRNYLSPEYFPAVCNAVMGVSRQDADNEEEFKAPSNAIKLKYDLKRLACIKLSEAIIDKNELRKSDAEAFLQLMDISYSDHLARVALFNRNLNIRKALPLPSDVQKLAAYINQQMTVFNRVDVSYNTYLRAVTLAEAKLISFNRRRCGEVQQIM